MAETPTPEAVAVAETLVLVERAYGHGRKDAVEQIALALDAYAQERELATWEAALNELPSGSLFEHLRETFYARATARERSG